MSEESTKKPTTKQPSIGSIEADLAFFSARDALIQHRPDTAYKRAQIKVHQAMTAELQSQLEEQQLKMKLRQARKAANKENSQT